MKLSVGCFHPSWIEINVNALRHNISLIRKKIGKTLYCLPVKANAYGHGLLQVAQIAEEMGVDYLAVAHLKEGVYLREEGISIPILVLGAIYEEQIPMLIDYQLEFSIASDFKADLVLKTLQGTGKKCRVHLEVDTGMRRTGVKPLTAEGLFQKLTAEDVFDLVGVYSHFATPDQGQLDVFLQLTETLASFKKPFIRHIASSVPLIHLPSSYLDMVRPSFLTFGYLEGETPSDLKGLAPCFSLKSRISYLKTVDEGEGISYGHSYRTSSKTSIATVPVGYGDGYLRALSNRGEVLIHGKRFPIVGSICMDQLMVDLGAEKAHVGDEVVLIGRQEKEEITAFEIAKLCNTIPYEILCLFNDRIPRLYL